MAGSTQETTPRDPQRAPKVSWPRVPVGIPRELPVSPGCPLTPAGGGASRCLPCPVPAQKQTHCRALGTACWEGPGQSGQSSLGLSHRLPRVAGPVSWSSGLTRWVRPSTPQAPLPAPCCPSESLIPTPHKLPSPPCTATPPALQCQLACVPRPDPPLSPGCRCHLLDDNAPSTALHPILT